MAEETQAANPESEVTGVDTSLVGKPVTELTPVELSKLASQLSALTTEIESRRKAIKTEAEDGAFGAICKVAKEQAAVLGWAKLPKLTLVPNIDGTDYTVAYSVTKKKGNGGGSRSTPDANGGKITINKIADVFGEIGWFRGPDGKDYEGENTGEALRNLVKSLKHPKTGEPESDICWDISKKGISASDIVTRRHADDVTIVFLDGSEKLVRVAVEEMKTARA